MFSAENSTTVYPAGNPDRIFDPEQNLFGADEAVINEPIDSDWWYHHMLLGYNMSDFVLDIFDRKERVCFICEPNKVFSNQNNVIRHLNEVHFGFNRRHCRRFSKQSNQERDQQVKKLTAGGNQIKPFSCVFPKCGRSYSYKNSLQKHQKKMQHKVAEN